MRSPRVSRRRSTTKTESVETTHQATDCRLRWGCDRRHGLQPAAEQFGIGPKRSTATCSTRTHSNKPSKFVVQGVWSYAEHNLGALREALAIQRKLYREHMARMPKAQRPIPLLDRLKQWWASDGDT